MFYLNTDRFFVFMIFTVKVSMTFLLKFRKITEAVRLLRLNKDGQDRDWRNHPEVWWFYYLCNSDTYTLISELKIDAPKLIVPGYKDELVQGCDCWSNLKLGNSSMYWWGYWAQLECKHWGVSFYIKITQRYLRYLKLIVHKHSSCCKRWKENTEVSFFF